MVISRLCIWYTLLTPFLRCPSRVSDLSDSSPTVCKPYLVARSHIEPHILPYYETYGAPYVDRARPYVVVFNDRVYSPVSNVAKQGYDKYGSPALNQAQAYSRKQWDSQVTPRVQAAQDRATELYRSEVDPYIQRGIAVVLPYYERGHATVMKAYANLLFPFYSYSRPFIGKTYTSGQDILTTTVLPYAQGTWSSAVYFGSRELWPKITGLYSENVEPQLVKIGQRLASYREGKRLRSVVDETERSVCIPLFPCDGSPHSLTEYKLFRTGNFYDQCRSSED